MASEGLVDGIVLVVARGPHAAAVLVGHVAQGLPPAVGGRSAAEHLVPQVVGGGVGQRRDVALDAGAHVHAVQALAVGGVGDGGLQFLRVLLGLTQAVGHAGGVGLGLNHGQLLAAVGQDVVGPLVFFAPAVAGEAAGGQFLPLDPGALDGGRARAPAGGLEGGVDQLGSGFGFVHFSLPLALLGSVSTYAHLGLSSRSAHLMSIQLGHRSPRKAN